MRRLRRLKRWVMPLICVLVMAWHRIFLSTFRENASDLPISGRKCGILRSVVNSHWCSTLIIVHVCFGTKMQLMH